MDITYLIYVPTMTNFLASCQCPRCSSTIIHTILDYLFTQILLKINNTNKIKRERWERESIPKIQLWVRRPFHLPPDLPTTSLSLLYIYASNIIPCSITAPKQSTISNRFFQLNIPFWRRKRFPVLWNSPVCWTLHWILMSSLSDSSMNLLYRYIHTNYNQSCRS